MRFAFFFVALSGLIVAGCQPQQAPERLVPVTGKITVKGQPLTQGTIVFHPDRERGNNSKHEPRAAISSGIYELDTGGQAGAPLGWYRVTVYALKTEGSTKAPVWLANQKYTDAKSSGLTAEVTEDSSKSVNFDLAR